MPSGARHHPLRHGTYPGRSITLISAAAHPPCLKQEICNSYHLEGTFGSVVSHWPEWPLQSGIRHPCMGGWRPDSPEGERVFIVRARRGQCGGVGGDNFDRGPMPKEVAVRATRYARGRVEIYADQEL